MNGHVGTVSGFSAAGVRVRLEDGREVTAPASHLQIGYAGTTYRGQGATNRAAFVLHEAATADRALPLVALTRHKEALKIYVDKTVTKGTRTLARQMSADKSSERNIGRFDLAAYDAQRAAKPQHQAKAPTPPRSAPPPQASAPATPAPAPKPTPANDERARRKVIEARIAELDRIESEKRQRIDEIEKHRPRLSPSRLDELRNARVAELKKIDQQIESKSGLLKSMFNKAEIADLRAQRAALLDGHKAKNSEAEKSKKAWNNCDRQNEAATAEFKATQKKHNFIKDAYMRAARYIGADAAAEKIWTYFAEGREGRTSTVDLKSVTYTQSRDVLERDGQAMTDAERATLRQTSGLDRQDVREALRASLAQSQARESQKRIEEQKQAEATRERSRGISF